MSQPMSPPPYPPPRRGLSNTAKFWIGVVATIPVLFLAGLVASLPSLVLGGLGIDPGGQVSGPLGLLVALALLGLYVAALVWERTRFLALGLLAGVAVLLVLAAGACVVLLTAYSRNA